jgi:hypothetical protein
MMLNRPRIVLCLSYNTKAFPMSESNKFAGQPVFIRPITNSY